MMKEYVNLIKEILYRDYLQTDERESTFNLVWLEEQIIAGTYYERGYSEEAAANEIYELFLKRKNE